AFAPNKQYRWAGHASVPLTPGNFIRPSILFLPSGGTQELISGSYQYAGRLGEVQYRIRFENTLEGVTSDVTQSITLPNAPNTWGNLYVNNPFEQIRAMR